MTAAALLWLTLPACQKVPIFDIEAGFSLADAAWFEEEETLFFFYDVSAEQGIGDPSLVEITYATDDVRLDWTDVTTLETVHTHLPVDCGLDARCGSISLHVPKEPREVDIRLRYHRDGELSLNASTVYNVVETGPAHSNRSLLIYGVFDETNQRVQWRARHQFPTVRNQQAEKYGLRRDFWVDGQRYGDAELTSSDNPYGYATGCPASLTDAGVSGVETDERAVFNDEDLPLDASSAPLVCGTSTVTDALGTFEASAVARKNPEVRPAFPELRSPVHDAVPIKFFLAPCRKIISSEHEEMQRQRLQMEDTETYCADDWSDPSFVDGLIADMRDAIEAQRPAGEDMVLVVGVHRDSAGMTAAVEEALAEVIPSERHRTTPRVAGAFVFDSDGRGLATDELESSTLWCPSVYPTDPNDVGNAASLTCALLPDTFDIELGPISLGALPILPSRAQYLEFIDQYSPRQAGSVETLTYLTPEFSTISDHFDIGTYGVVTFLDDEFITADADDAFSYCTQELSTFFAFRSPLMQSDVFEELLKKKCGGSEDTDTGGLGGLCDFLEQGALPVELLPEWHGFLPEGQYDLGVFWDFPFLLRMEYEAVGAVSVSAFGLSVPFGFAADAETYYGSQLWLNEVFDLSDLLTQCRRFCDHPTFGSAGVYRVTEPFRTTYAQACYLPEYPELGDSGFPRDP